MYGNINLFLDDRATNLNEKKSEKKNLEINSIFFRSEGLQSRGGSFL